MFSRSALARSLAVSEQLCTRPSVTRIQASSSPLRNAAASFHQKSYTAQQATQTTPSSSSASSSAPFTPPTTATSTTTTAPTTPTTQQTKIPPPPQFTTPLKASESLLATLPHLAAQRPHFLTAHIHDRPYLITEGDSVRLPFLMAGVEPGDVLRLNRASVVGSREFSLKGAPFVDERLFECRVRVMGVDAEPLRIKEKTKRRNRHVQRITSKHRYTLLRVMEVRVKGVEELREEGVDVVKE
ncbi:mitochondrial 54S ribosomal protein bL21m [Aspergillus candidus]|uniref:Large ribosomal subunit protein bL21m n=1 Tax=Aspergillus candidus TaxID=41067 RepID=A0A2I2FCH0_ASPCN|nr:ribosomal protein L21-like protein [Aspergillus candidus]PLB38331.1 ribosomal protein L21-like protein [Aspergillus candidus]